MSTRRSTGVILIASGSIGLFIGLVLSASFVGAICGVPLILVCIPMMIWGYLMKAKDKEIKEEQFAERMLMTQAVASGINICPQCKTPNQNTNPACLGCGFRFAPLGDPQPVSAIDPTEISFRARQIDDRKKPIIESDSADS